MTKINLDFLTDPTFKIGYEIRFKHIRGEITVSSLDAQSVAELRKLYAEGHIKLSSEVYKAKITRQSSKPESVEAANYQLCG